MRTIEQNTSRRREKGAALLTVLLVSTMLLAAGGALLLTTSSTTTTAADSTAEAQAYYAAEAGINEAVNVLRGNSAAATAATFRNVADSLNMNPWLEYTAVGARNLVVVSANPGLAYEIAVTPDGTLAPLQPRQLVLNVTGYGPKGSRKQLEMVVDRHTFDYSPLATILMRGASDNKSTMPSFYIGESNVKTYSGIDNAIPSTGSIPVFGTTHADDFAGATIHIEEAKPNTISGVDKVKQYNESELPTFLQTADNARAFLNTMQDLAISSDRYFKGAPASFGTDANPMLTFVDGDVDLPGGTGLLIVTGKLTMNGNPSFNGLILVLGEGYIERDGGGSGDILGAIVVSKFARTWPVEENDEEHPFLAPTYLTNGAGSSTVAFDSVKLDQALSIAGLRTMGIRER